MNLSECAAARRVLDAIETLVSTNSSYATADEFFTGGRCDVARTGPVFGIARFARK